MSIEFPGAIHHVMSRGDRREDIFHDEVFRQDFLKTIGESCQKADFQVLAYCLMGSWESVSARLEERKHKEKIKN